MLYLDVGDRTAAFVQNNIIRKNILHVEKHTVVKCATFLHVFITSVSMFYKVDVKKQKSYLKCKNIIKKNNFCENLSSTALILNDNFKLSRR